MRPHRYATSKEEFVMRKLFGLIAAATLVVAGQAHAASLGFTGTLEVAITGLSPISATGAGTATVSGVDLTSLQVPAGVFSKAFFSVAVTDPAAFPIAGVQAKNIKNGAVLTGFNLAGKMGIQGVSTVCLFGACNGVGSGAPSANLVVPFTENGTRGVGIGGAGIFKKGAVNITVNGNPWTSGVAKVGTVTAAGFIHGPASGGAATAGQAGGVVQLVTPTVISTNIGASAALPAFGVMRITFSAVPEPGTLLLLTSGVVGLAILGRNRMSK
jgi:hypothetical protein